MESVLVANGAEMSTAAGVACDERTAVCVCYGEEVSADFERREGGTEGNRGCFCPAIAPLSHTQNVREPRVSCGKHK